MLKLITKPHHYNYYNGQYNNKYLTIMLFYRTFDKIYCENNKQQNIYPIKNTSNTFLNNCINYATIFYVPNVACHHIRILFSFS